MGGGHNGKMVKEGVLGGGNNGRGCNGRRALWERV